MDVTGTPDTAMARGSPRPMLTPVSTFSAWGVEFPHRLAQPAFQPHLVRLASVPDVHAPEVGAVGIGIADALDDSHAALVVEALEGRGVGVDGQFVVDGQSFIGIDDDFLPGRRSNVRW